MTIRLAASTEVGEILSIYGDAREYMRASGNHGQWTGGYPSRSVVEEDISLGRLFVAVDGDEIWSSTRQATLLPPSAIAATVR